MSYRQWWRGVLAVVLVAPSLSLFAASGLAPTPEQLQALQQLPAAQRELLRRAFKDDGSFSRSKLETIDDELNDAQGDSPHAAQPLSAPVPLRDIRLKAGDTLLIELSPMPTVPVEAGAKPSTQQPLVTETPEPATAEERALQHQRRQEEEILQQARLPKQRLFVLDQFGALNLHNIGRIVLLGLTEREAAERLEAESAFHGLRVRVKHLPLETELKRFGHDLFVKPPRGFAPAANIPPPADYVVGPGDTVLVQLYGKENTEHELTVTRDGTLMFPGIGPISVAGMKFSQLQKDLQSRVQRQFIGGRASVTLGRLRSIRVFILGEVEKPGSYTVSGLSTLSNALFASGGVTPAGSLRDVQLKRDGQVVARLDLYDLLLNGDARNDARLMPGDVIFIPPAGPIVGVSGRVRRPALYELRDEQTLDGVLAMAGGVLADAHPRSVQIERVWEGQARSVLTADLTQPQNRAIPMRDGDVVRVYAIAERLEESVKLSGWVVRPGDYQWKPTMRLVDLLPSLAALRPEADAHYILIKRDNPPDRAVELSSANLVKALADPSGPANVVLKPRDELHIFSVHEDRATLVKPMLDRARATSSPAQPVREVWVEGAVHHPGRYPWSQAMTVDDLIDAAGGLTERAYLPAVELTRAAAIGAQTREPARQLIDITRSAVDGEARVVLQPSDRIVVRRIPQWEEDGVVELFGEVKFPGRYPIARGERLSQVIRRAGGLTDAAYPQAAVFLRQSVREREQQYLERLTAQLERDLGVLKTEGPEIGIKREAALLEGEALLRQMRAAKATGRMVVRLNEILRADADYDVTVQPGDKLVIPQRPDEITIIGEVYYPTSHVYIAGHTRDQYLQLSGGITERGNKRAVYVVRADGSVIPPSGWFGGDVAVGPGDTVIVPLKVDRISKLKLITDISTIIYQLAITAAALNVIGVL